MSEQHSVLNFDSSRRLQQDLDHARSREALLKEQIEGMRLKIKSEGGETVSLNFFIECASPLC